MKIIKIIGSLAAALTLGMTACQTGGAPQEDLTQYVNPFIGSGEHGHVFVGASVPFGAVTVGPTNIFKGWDWCSGYHYTDSILTGFAHTHLSGTGCTDMGDFLLMPYVGEMCTKRGMPEDISGSVSVRYTHEQETAKPGYYKIDMENGITAELTATERVAFHRYSFPEEAEKHILLNLLEGISSKALATSVKRVDSHTLQGYRVTKGWVPLRKIYFSMRFDQEIDSVVVFNNNNRVGLDSLTIDSPENAPQFMFYTENIDSLPTNGVKAVVTLKDNAKEVTCCLAISSVSCENAQLNLETETKGLDFDKAHQLATEKWNNELSKITIETDDPVEREKFYTAMYHAAINPQLYCDVNGEYRGLDDQIHTAPANSKNYTTLSQWDVYRTQMPLFTLINPEMMPDFVNTYNSICDQQGRYPVWTLMNGETNCMPGYSSVIIAADAYLKGLLPEEMAEKTLECMITTTMSDNMSGIKLLKEMGYIPCDKVHEATSKALEYAVADAGLAQMAKKMGRQDVYEKYLKRSKAYETYYDNTIGFIRPKMEDGTWRTPYSPERSVHEVGDFTEGTGWQYTFFNAQNPEDMIRIQGGEEAFTAKFDSLFVAGQNFGEQASADISGLIGQYAHGNEPSHAFLYYYNWVGQQWKTAERVRFVQKEFYTNKPDGIIGNEDCGQMSSWYIMSALGFYQVTPAGGQFIFGSPLFKKATINLPGKKTFTILAPNNSDENIYIQSAKLNGEPYTKTFITYEDIMKGGTLEFEMGNQPNKEYGAAKEDRPFTEE